MKSKFFSLILASVSALTFITTTAFAFSPPPIPLVRIEIDSLQTELENTNFLTVNFHNASLDDALSFVTEQSAKASDGKVQMHIVSKLPKDAPSALPKITLYLRDLSALETLQYVCCIAGVDFEIQTNDVVIKPKTPKTPEDKAEQLKSENKKYSEVGSLYRSLQQIILPKVEMNHTPFVTAIDDIQNKVDQISKSKVNLLVAFRGKSSDLHYQFVPVILRRSQSSSASQFTKTLIAETPAKVTLKLTNVSAMDVLEKIAEQNHLIIAYNFTSIEIEQPPPSDASNIGTQ